jgi:hypothetical protein
LPEGKYFWVFVQDIFLLLQFLLIFFVMNRFVILLHKSVAVEHWDVMLEVLVDGCGQLETWSISPQANLHETESGNLNYKLKSFSCPAKKLPYHRIAYLDYEGEISNNRGNVKRIDKGKYQKINDNKFRLYGKLLDGELTIINNKNNSNNSCEIIFKITSDKIN